MSKQNHKRSKITGTLWLGMAVFFLVFCSCPVKRYIRLHLYSQKKVVENAAGDRYATYDIKDCTIADRHQQSEITILSFLQRPADDLHHQDAFFVPSLLPGIAFSSVQKDEYNEAISLHRGITMPMPLYLWVRHLQV